MSATRRTFRTWTARTTAIALGVAVLVPSALATQGAGAVTPHATSPRTTTPHATTPAQGMPISGIVTVSGTNAPVAGACVYPIVQVIQHIPVTNTATQNYMIQTFAGACTDAMGNYNLTLAPTLTADTSIPYLIVVPPDSSLAGTFFNSSVTHDAALKPATNTATGQVLSGMSPAPNTLVEFFDSGSGTVLGFATADAMGSYSAGLALTGTVNVVAGAVGAPGTDFSLDLQAQQTMDMVAPGDALPVPPIQEVAHATVSGQVVLPGGLPHPWQIVQASCVSGCNNGVIGETLADGTFSMSLPQGSVVDLSYGNTVQRVTLTNDTQVPNAQTQPDGSADLTYGAAPITYLSAGPLLSLDRKVSWSWSGASLESAPEGWYRSVATASWNKALSKYSANAVTTTQSRTAKLGFGASECDRIKTFTVLAGSGPAANVSAPVTSCQTVPLDDRSFVASKSWKKTAASKAFGGTIVSTSTLKQTLTLSGVTGHQLVVLWSRSTKGGTFSVSVNGKVIKSISTKGATAYQKVTYLPVKWIAKAKVVITTTKAGSVAIDGLAVLP
jgi:hypothetical protein